MKLSQMLRPELVQVPLRATDKWQAIGALARAAVAAHSIPEDLLPVVEEALFARERSMTTGMEHGIAIPHAAVDGLEEVVAILGLAPGGIPFETLDGEDAHIIVCLVIPRSKKLLHIRTLAEIAKLLSQALVRDELVACASAGEAIDILVRHEGS